MLRSDGSPLVVRSRARLIACCAALAVLAALAMPAASGANIVQTQLSLGDSQAFGYSQQLFNENALAEPPTQFEKGYANRFFTLHNPVLNKIQLVNDGCPGETVDSFIGNGPVGAVMDPDDTSGPCQYHNAAGYPLHHSYGGGGRSQLESALEMITVETLAGTPVTTITLNIGNNDLIHTVLKCETQVAGEFAANGTSVWGATAPAAVNACISAEIPAAIAHVVADTAQIFYTLRHGSLFGGIDYTGEIVFLGTYNPYGKLFSNAAQLAVAVSTEGLNVAHYAFINKTTELLPGWGGVTGLLNTLEAAQAPTYSVCYANPQKTSFAFPAFYGFNELPAAEPGKLKVLTNMANLNLFGLLFDGPDPHPTVAGYLRLARIMNYSCPNAPS